MRFKDKVVFITGGGQGLGEHFGKAFAREGAAAVLADVNVPRAEEAAQGIRQAGGKALAVRCDVTDREAVESAAAETIKAFGGIDYLINNAGRHLTDYAQPITELSIERWKDLLDVNVMGIVHCSAVCKRSMIERGGGVIVNMSSSAGFLVNHAYGVSKLAVRGLTIALSMELADKNIRVFGMAPGVMDSGVVMEELRPKLEAFIARQLIKRQGRMDDLIGPLFFMCADDSSFMTGETLLVAGGYPTRL